MDTKYIKTIEEYVACTKSIKEYYNRKDMKYGDKTLPFFLTINTLSKKQLDIIQLKIESLTGIIDKIVTAHLTYNKFSSEFEFSNKELEIMQIPRGFKTINVFNRYDLFFYKNNFKIIEINPESPSGMGRIPFIDYIFLKQGLFNIKKKKIKKLFDTRNSLLKGFLKTYAEWGGKKKKPTIAIVDKKGVKTISDQIFLKDYFEAKGCKTIICNPIELKSNKGLYCKKIKIDIVYRRFLTTDYLNTPNQFKELINSLKDKTVCMINPFVSRIVGDKSLLAKLREGVFDELLTSNEKKLVKEVLPWSMELNPPSVNLYGGKDATLSYALANKNKLVLKPSISYGGVNVFIGNETSEKAWELALERALKEQKWILQEFLEIPTITVPTVQNKKIIYIEKYINLCPYVINKKIAGFVTRISGSKVINTTQGGGMIPTFIY